MTSQSRAASVFLPSNVKEPLVRISVAVLAASAIMAPICVTTAHAASPAPSGKETSKTAPARGALDLSKVTVPTLAWKNCTDKDLKGFQCTTALLPLDYSKPHGDKIEVTVAKKNATGKKKGAIFTNPGGPGEVATKKLKEFVGILGKEVNESHDILAIDPRGIAGSTETKCWSDKAAPKGDDIRFPITSERVSQKLAYDVFYRDACAKTARPIMDHISTAQVARDMEMIRKAMGEQKLNYYGVSYGTYLGATYTALFPHTVGRMVTDGVVDPIAWSTGHGKDGDNIPSTLRGGAADSSLDTLKAAFAECKKAGPKACPHGATIEKEWDEVLETLKKGPFKDGKETHTFDSYVSDAGVALYDNQGIRDLFASVHHTWEAMTKKNGKSTTPATAPAHPKATTGQTNPKATTPAAPKPEPTSATPAAPSNQTPVKPLKEAAQEAKQRAIAKAPLGLPAAGATAGKPVAPGKPAPNKPAWSDSPELFAVLCVDTKNPKDPKAWEKYSTPEHVKKNPFLTYWAWGSSVCAGWPGQDKNIYQGPFNVTPANPLLVIGNTHDPSTPLKNAQTLAKLSPGARLLTVDTFGHVAGNKNICAAKALRSYFINGTLPAEGTICKADGPLFQST
ncbi:hypothetical protein KEM60_00107 [Austwickia sp. TVS 96-490-7B]|uniref:alpha/beta hydrolase n=1 Tax=Austwickia sp. TVS 96-490-7B TaxID=2830843 RepID=UPI001C55E428|nr:alpha/beta hydrolase [Austwickia sp. TVS 96-490-7B]MBW3083925.1 hypothetical protein [Austwickia sp. TVS 96-490-7B]